VTAPPADPSQMPPAEPARDPIRASQQAMRTPLPKRFYKEAGVIERDGGFHIALDGRTAKTPGRNALALPTRPAAEAVAAEWAAQGERIDPAAMPVTRLANSAIDGVAIDAAPVREEILKHAACDLLCYRAGEPERLVARQADLWDPVLAWADAALGARFFLAQGVSFVSQPPSSRAAIARAVDAVPAPFGLAALNGISRPKRPGPRRMWTRTCRSRPGGRTRRPSCAAPAALPILPPPPRCCGG
jgi:chaperone required for assembly of F1-ATPase